MVLEPDLVTKLRDDEFGEGLSPRSATEFVLLTWRERRIYSVNRTDMSIIEEFELDRNIKEGWGVTADESNVGTNGYYQLYVTDGSDKIYLLDGETLEVTSSISVYDPATDSYVENLNELEFVKGHIYANVWYKEKIVKIDP